MKIIGGPFEFTFKTKNSNLELGKDFAFSCEER